MNYDNINKVLEELERLNPRKAKKLRNLVEMEQQETNPEQKEVIMKKMRTYIFNVFLSCLARKTRNDITNTGVCINEDCYTVEQHADDRWIITLDGASRYDFEGEQLVKVGSIPREYKTGFHLEERDPVTEQDRINQQKEQEFYLRFHVYLDRIGEMMDHKQELVTDGYEINNPRIPREFVELLITTIGLQRVPTQVKKETK